jgi:hypothetical protein
VISATLILETDVNQTEQLETHLLGLTFARTTKACHRVPEEGQNANAANGTEGRGTQRGIHPHGIKSDQYAGLALSKGESTELVVS